MSCSVILTHGLYVIFTISMLTFDSMLAIIEMKVNQQMYIRVAFEKNGKIPYDKLDNIIEKLA